MTVSALTRPGERDRLIVKIGEIDWIFCLTLCLIAGAGAVMLFSIAGSSWTPWAAPHLMRFALFFAIMIVLALVNLRVWLALAYPIYGLPSKETIEAIRLSARLEGMMTDPVYEGKSMQGLIDLVRKGFFPAGSKILYAHLGGVPAINGYSYTFRNG